MPSLPAVESVCPHFPLVSDHDGAAPERLHPAEGVRAAPQLVEEEGPGGVETPEAVFQLGVVGAVPCHQEQSLRRVPRPREDLEEVGQVPRAGRQEGDGHGGGGGLLPGGEQLPEGERGDGDVPPGGRPDQRRSLPDEAAAMDEPDLFGSGISGISTNTILFLFFLTEQVPPPAGSNPDLSRPRSDQTRTS